MNVDPFALPMTQRELRTIADQLLTLQVTIDKMSQRLSRLEEMLTLKHAVIRWNYTPMEEAWIEDISKFIDKKDFEMARTILADLQKRVGEDDPEVIRAATTISFLEGDD